MRWHLRASWEVMATVVIARGGVSDEILMRPSENLRQHLDKTDWSRQSPSRQRILEVFLRLAVENGFNSVSMRMLGKALDIKAPSVYSHFPGGRDEIVAESLRWHFHQFGTALLAEVDKESSADEYWDALVRVHVVRQLTLPESNLWDLLVASDRMAGFLPDGLRLEVTEWIELHEAMYRAAARALGVESPEEPVRIVVTLLEGATRWCQWSGSDDELPALTRHVVALTRSVLTIAQT